MANMPSTRSQVFQVCENDPYRDTAVATSGSRLADSGSGPQPIFAIELTHWKDGDPHPRDLINARRRTPQS
jgi:hypothetical protein